MIRPLSDNETVILALAGAAMGAIATAVTRKDGTIEPKAVLGAMPTYVRAAIVETEPMLCDAFHYVVAGDHEYLIGKDSAGLLFLKHWERGAEVAGEVPLFTAAQLETARVKVSSQAWSFVGFLKQSWTTVGVAFVLAGLGALLWSVLGETTLATVFLSAAAVIVIGVGLLNWTMMRVVRRQVVSAITEAMEAPAVVPSGTAKAA